VEFIDLRNVKWFSTTGGTTGGMLPKCSFVAGERLKYVKLSAYNAAYGVYGLEAVYEVIASRVGLRFGVNCLRYDLARILVRMDGKEFETIACVSDDFRVGRETESFESYFLNKRVGQETPLELAYRIGLKENMHKMFVFDYITMQMDRHGRNIELFVDETGGMTPLFDNSLCLCGKISDDGLGRFCFDDGVEVNNFLGSRNLLYNLRIVAEHGPVGLALTEDFGTLFLGLEDFVSETRRDFICDAVKRRFDYARSVGAVL
jgi:hypothetical protein